MEPQEEKISSFNLSLMMELLPEVTELTSLRMNSKFLDLGLQLMVLIALRQSSTTPEE